MPDGYNPVPMMDQCEAQKALAPCVSPATYRQDSSHMRWFNDTNFKWPAGLPIPACNEAGEPVGGMGISKCVVCPGECAVLHKGVQYEITLPEGSEVPKQGDPLYVAFDEATGTFSGSVTPPELGWSAGFAVVSRDASSADAGNGLCVDGYICECYEPEIFGDKATVEPPAEEEETP